MVGRCAPFPTRALPFAGRTIAPLGLAGRLALHTRGLRLWLLTACLAPRDQVTPCREGNQWLARDARPNNMRAEGPGVRPAKGNALVIGATPGDNLSAQRANHSHAAMDDERLARWAERRGETMVGPCAPFPTRALPFAGRTDAPSGLAGRLALHARGFRPWLLTGPAGEPQA